MKLKLWVVIALLGSLAACKSGSTAEENDWKKMELSGKVKSVTETMYEAVEGLSGIEAGAIQTEPFYSYLEFNKSGMVVENEYLDNDYGMRVRIVSKYDKNGNRIEEASYDEDGNLDERSVFKYDKNGNMLEGVSYDLDGAELYRLSSIYDDNNNIIETSVNSSMGDDMQRKVIYKYDEKGNKTAEDMYANETVLVAASTFQYDENDNLIETYMNYVMQNDGGRGVYKYDDRGNKIEETAYDLEGNFSGKGIYKYDGENREIEIVSFNADSSMTTEVAYVYNDLGKVARQTQTRTMRVLREYGDGSGVEYISEGDKWHEMTQSYTNEYPEFDQRGNWTKQIIYVDGEPMMVTLREIAYY